MASSTAATLWVLFFTCLIFCYSPVAAKNDAEKQPSKALNGVSKVTIYANGSLGSGFLDASRGCVRCNWAETNQSRNASKASLTATVAPWGSIIIAAIDLQPKSSMLDFWARGSGLNSIALYLKDSKANVQTSDIRFARATLDAATSGLWSVIASDNDGWLRIRINLANLITSCGSNSFDRIIFEDVSGMGFNLQLDAIQLLVGEATFAASALPTFQAGDLLPVHGDDLTMLKSAPLRYITKLKPSATMGAIASICNELSGKQHSGGRRFKGICNTPLSTIGTPSAAGSNPSWKFLTLTVSSPEDLKALRTHLADLVEYFEADLTVYSTVRSLKVVEELNKHDNAKKAATRSPEGGASPVKSVDITKGEDITPGNVQVVRGHDVNDTEDTVGGVSSNTDGNTISASAIEPIGMTTVFQFDILAAIKKAMADRTSPFPSPAPSPSPTGLNSTGVNSTGLNSTGLNSTGLNSTGLNSTGLNTTGLDSTGLNSTGLNNTGLKASPYTPAVTILGPANNTKDDYIGGINPIIHDDISVGLSEQYGSAASSVPWGLDRIDQYYLPMDGRYNNGDYDGRGVHIYVLDTGVRASHVDFTGRVGDGASAVGNSVNDDNGHGTNCAGTALGAIHGVARSAILHPVKVLGADGTGSYSNFVSGIQWVKDHKARNNIRSAVISMSLSGPYSASLNDAVKSATDAGIVVVVAAGNNRGADACTMSPASASTAITVGASAPGSGRDDLASFSNIGPCLSLFAPGQSITSASKNGDQAESTMSGTSQATPHVAGAAALYLQYRPGASPYEVKIALMRAATPVKFESSSPERLLNIMSDRLRAAGPQPTTQPAQQPAQQPTTTSPAAKPSTPTTTTPTFFGAFGKPAWCNTCSWCAFCS